MFRNTIAISIVLLFLIACETTEEPQYLFSSQRECEEKYGVNQCNQIQEKQEVAYDPYPDNITRHGGGSMPHIFYYPMIHSATIGERMGLSGSAASAFSNKPGMVTSLKPGTLTGNSNVGRFASPSLRTSPSLAGTRGFGSFGRSGGFGSSGVARGGGSFSAGS